MGILVDIAVVLLLAILLGGTATLFFLGRFTTRTVKQVAQKVRGVLPERKALTMRPPAAPEQVDDELLAYPRRLELLELQLSERIVAAHSQQRLVEARLSELKSKEKRQELTGRYEEDVALLVRRQQSMKRVLGKVWKTRAILLLRVHLAATARRKPTFENLPDPGSKPTVSTLKRATGAFHEAAASVRYYLEEVRERRESLPQVVPKPMEEAELDETIREAVRLEALATDRAYEDLLEQMDQLADNLTYLGDHYATVAVVAESPTSTPEGSAALLLEQVESSIVALDQLAKLVDPNSVDAAVDHLAADISRLEQAGQEVSAEADASLEVENLLRQTAGS